MKQDLLYSLIDHLSARQIKEAKLWLASPLHNQRGELHSFFELLTETRLALNVSLRPEEYWHRLWPTQVFSATNWRQLRHRLLRQLEDYLTFNQLSQQPYQQRRQLMKAYREQGLNAHLQTRLNRYRPDTSAGPDRYHYEYDHEVERYHLESGSDVRNRDYNLREQETQLERYILAISLRQACTTLAHQRVHPLNFDLPLLPHLLERAAQDQYKDEPGVRLFYLACQLYLLDAQKAEPFFKELRQGLFELSNRFPAADQYNLLILSINHCLRESNAGREYYLHDTLELYQFGLQQSILLENGQLGSRTFNNITGVALRLGETEWVTSFLDQYENLLPQLGRTEITSLVRARIALEQKDYSATLGYLQAADYQDFYHHMTARVLQLKVYFARDNYNLISSHLRASRSYLQRRRQLGYHHNNYSNIFRLAHKTTRLPPGDRAAAAKIKEEILTTEPCTERPWLLGLLER